MPSYQVKRKGFFGGKLYDPDGKRPVLSVDKPFTDKDMPSWVTPIKETAAPKARTKGKAKAKVESPKDEPSFMEDDASNSVETL